MNASLFIFKERVTPIEGSLFIFKGRMTPIEGSLFIFKERVTQKGTLQGNGDAHKGIIVYL